ncbi:MAG: hypothetical protein EPN25_13480 [Nitrospirae bacterium]|nr:MAG: hypothetical protein EPN25_13480 [Nitrospirota bacterium]
MRNRRSKSDIVLKGLSVALALVMIAATSSYAGIAPSPFKAKKAAEPAAVQTQPKVNLPAGADVVKPLVTSDLRAIFLDPLPPYLVDAGATLPTIRVRVFNDGPKTVKKATVIIVLCDSATTVKPQPDYISTLEISPGGQYVNPMILGQGGIVLQNMPGKSQKDLEFSGLKIPAVIPNPNSRPSLDHKLVVMVDSGALEVESNEENNVTHRSIVIKTPAPHIVALAPFKNKGLITVPVKNTGNQALHPQATVSIDVTVFCPDGMRPGIMGGQMPDQNFRAVGGVTNVSIRPTDYIYCTGKVSFAVTRVAWSAPGEMPNIESYPSQLYDFVIP